MIPLPTWLAEDDECPVNATGRGGRNMRGQDRNATEQHLSDAPMLGKGLAVWTTYCKLFHAPNLLWKLSMQCTIRSSLYQNKYFIFNQPVLVMIRDEMLWYLHIARSCSSLYATCSALSFFCKHKITRYQYLYINLTLVSCDSYSANSGLITETSC